MKRVKFIGNFYVAYTMAIPFVFGGAAVIETNTFVLDIHPAIFIIALIAFLTGSGREIMKDVQDYEGDRQKGVRSFPKYIGKRASNILSGLFYITAITLSFLPFILKEYTIYYSNLAYFLPVLVCDALLLITALQLLFKKDPNLKTYRKITLIAIFIGLVAFLLGSLIKI
jgi:geranylgeranylglycerol-phosphate geranylgeranyltransferase